MKYPLFFLLLQGFLFIKTTHASPFAITDHYIHSYEEGIQELVKTAHETHHHEGEYDPSHYDEMEALKDAHEYDFIIVGSGTSGSVIANRLSEIPEWKVLVLEAGGPETPYMQIPTMTNYVRGTHYNWGYTTVPQHSWCLGMIDKQCAYESGKGLGGSTLINSMLYTRGNARDYDLWADQGNKQWCFNDVLPYFKKSEDSQLHHFDRKHHHQGGPMHVENLQHISDMTELFLHAGKELGYNIVDYNGKHQLGFSKSQATTKYGKRFSGAAAYLSPTKPRQNVEIKTHSHVIEVTVNPHTKEASGVKYLHDGKLFIAKADKEIILTAGAFHTPQLLMLSGIGPKEHLEELHIPVIHDLPVGKYMKENVAFMGLNFLTHEEKHEEANPKHNLIDWLKEGKGPLTSIGNEALAFIKTKASKDHVNYPDVELIFSPQSSFLNEMEMTNLRIKQEIYGNMKTISLGNKTFSIAVVGTHPKSVGSLKLKSKNPFHWPLIDSNRFSDLDDHDLETVLAGIKVALEVAETTPFKKLGTHLYKQPVAGCDQYEFATDDYWICAIKHVSVSIGEQTGTCRMGPESDKHAVVDNQLQVRGIHKLRVADASIIPVSITGHLHAPLVMIGEKAADLIKHYWE